MGIGRDLVRLLQNVARLPEFESLWRDAMLDPSVLAPNFAGRSAAFPTSLYILLTCTSAIDICNNEKNLLDLTLNIA